MLDNIPPDVYINVQKCTSPRGKALSFHLIHILEVLNMDSWIINHLTPEETIQHYHSMLAFWASVEQHSKVHKHTARKAIALYDKQLMRRKHGFKSSNTDIRSSVCA